MVFNWLKTEWNILANNFYWKKIFTEEFFYWMIFYTEKISLPNEKVNWMV